MSKKKWYKRKHQFTPYTKADGQAVSDEFDAIQASFERIPEMRDDGKGFEVSPLIPEPTEPNHPVPFKMLTETEASVNNARDDVIAKAQQVAQNTQTVETNTQTAINQANSATQSATSAAASSQSADESEDWARKWASNPIDEPVSGDKYSAYHYASKAAISAQNLSTAEQSAKTNANIAVQKAEEAKISASQARSIADGEVEYGKVLNVPRASGTQAGIVQLTDDTGIDSDKLGLSARAGKKLAQMIATVQLALNNYIPLNKRSSAVNSNDENNVATSKAVKTAYDKGVEAKNAADGANNNANNRVSKSGDTMTGNLTVPNLIVNDPTNNNNFVQIGDDTKLIDVDMGHTVGLQTTDNANDAYIAYGETKKRFGFDGYMFFSDSALATNHIGQGSYAQQYNVAAPFYVHQTSSVARDTYHPFVKGRVRAAGEYGAAFSLGYTTKQGSGDGYGKGIINLVSDSGHSLNWSYEHNGDFYSANDVITGSGNSLNILRQNFNDLFAKTIYREGEPHDIAISWLSNGLKVRVDATDLGRVAFQQDIHNTLRGAVCAFAMSHPPAGWLKCNGAAVSRTAYADLFSIIGTHYGAGDGHSTFNLPDLRGEFIRGIDEGRGADPNRAFGSWQSDEIRSHNHFIQFDGVAAGSRGAAEGAIHSGSGKPYYTDHTGGNETRPRNVALLYCIKY